MVFLKRLLPIALAASAGCEFVREPTSVELPDRPVTVHAVLAAGSDRATVLLTTTSDDIGGPRWRTPNDAQAQPVSGADVWLIAGEDTLRLSEAPAGFPACLGARGSPLAAERVEEAGPGCYAARVPGGIRRGVRYQLRISLPHGGTVEGAAEVPANDPGILAPDPRARIEVRVGQGHVWGGAGAVPVRFRAPAGAAGVGLSLRPEVAFANDTAAEGVRCHAEAPAIVAPVEHSGVLPLTIFYLECFRGEGKDARAFAADSVRARLLVTAHDSAYMRYRPVLSGENVSPAVASQGVSGALGLFSGAATAEREITLVPVREPQR